MFLIRVSGPSGSGKTSVAEHIISAAHKKGIKVSFIKDIPHDDAEFDRFGKDTYRAIVGGAVMSAGRSPSKSFISIYGYVGLNDLLKFMENNSDVCIVEGFRLEASSIKFDIHIEIQTHQTDHGFVNIKASVKSADSFNDFDLAYGDTNLVSFVLETIMAKAQK